MSSDPGVLFASMRRHAVCGLGVVIALMVSGSGAALDSGRRDPANALHDSRAVGREAARYGASMSRNQVPHPGERLGETALEHAAEHLDPGYGCPMHPQMVQKEPGSCPICGMDLVSTAEARKQTATGHSDGRTNDPHAHHRQMMNQKGYSRSEHGYGLPDLALVDKSGEKTSLLQEVNVGKPVMLNFIFTTCTTICPILSATFSRVQEQLGDDADEVRMISITIDPEHDTPERLEAYAARFKAGSQWQFLTGDPDRIVAVQKAFDAYRGSKMNHEPLTFLRVGEEAPWVRLGGLAGAADVIEEYRQLVAKRDQAR